MFDQKTPEANNKSGSTYFGSFVFSPTVKIENLMQVNNFLGGKPWKDIQMTYEQLKDYTYLVPSCGSLATNINAIPIIVYGHSDEPSY